MIQCGSAEPAIISAIIVTIIPERESDRDLARARRPKKDDKKPRNYANGQRRREAASSQQAIHTSGAGAISRKLADVGRRAASNLENARHQPAARVTRTRNRQAFGESSNNGNKKVARHGNVIWQWRLARP
jgi:hypothetical protein